VVVRARSAAKYPYDIVYFATDTDTEIVIVAYARNSRKPGYWKRRVGD
jgi:hypothetical protein